MGQIIPFSQFESYMAENAISGDLERGTILDTNILISLTYEVKSNHEEVMDFFMEHLAPEKSDGFRIFTTVNTRSEFLDFYRRLLMTENLRDVIDEGSPWIIPAK